MVKLLNCAHCGCDGARLLRTVENGTIYWHVECPDCGISTTRYPEPEGDTRHVHDEEYARMAMSDAIDCAVSMWNSRVDVPCKACEYADECDDEDDDGCGGVEELTTDEIVSLTKRCIDMLFKKVHSAMKDISDAMEDKHD